MSEVLEKYKIYFFVKIINGKKYRTLSSSIEDISHYIGNYCLDLDNPKYLDPHIIDINEVIEEKRPTFESFVNVQNVIITSLESHFFELDQDSENGFEPLGFIIPTKDLRDILIEWGKFIEKPIE